MPRGLPIESRSDHTMNWEQPAFLTNVFIAENKTGKAVCMKKREFAPG